MGPSESERRNTDLRSMSAMFPVLSAVCGSCDVLLADLGLPALRNAGVLLLSSEALSAGLFKVFVLCSMIESSSGSSSSIESSLRL